MKLFWILKNIYDHPLNKHARFAALARFFKWQLLSRFAGLPLVFPFVKNSVLIVEKGMVGATGNIYNGLHEYQDMLFALHFLRSDDLFVDVGANVGTYTILASVNSGARVVSFEPISHTFDHLRRNVLVNDVLDKVELVNKAVANEIKTLHFTANLDAANHAVNGSLKNQVVVKVDCTTLDEALRETPGLIKIDVEGFETEVIEGGKLTLAEPKLKAIIIELNGLGSRYGYNEENIHDTLLSYGFSPFEYDPFVRELKPIQHWGSHNSIYIRDLDFVKKRVLEGPRVFVNNLEV